ncbi:hypothetical protein BHE74_00019865 [Ensete ventricosum]|nr:hypothetical protein BHE74_00019865 [Ensete ventricosum]
MQMRQCDVTQNDVVVSENEEEAKRYDIDAEEVVRHCTEQCFSQGILFIIVFLFPSRHRWEDARREDERRLRPVASDGNADLRPYRSIPAVNPVDRRRHGSDPAARSPEMNIFRLAGDVTHLTSGVLVLLLKIHTIKSCAGKFRYLFRSPSLVSLAVRPI